MRLVKRAPATWGLLAFVTLVTEIAVEAIPDVGPMLGKIVVPLVACGMLYAAAATDGGAAPSLAARGGRLSRTRSRHRRRHRGRPHSPSPPRRWLRGGSPAPTCSQRNPPPTRCRRRRSAASTPSGYSRRCRSRSCPSTCCSSRCRSAPRSRRAGTRLSGTPCRCSSTPRHRSCCWASAWRRWASVSSSSLPLWAASSYAAWKDIFAVSDAPAER